MKKIIIKLPFLSEEIYIGGGISDFVTRKIYSRDYDKVVVVTDHNVLRKYNRNLKDLLKFKIQDLIIVRPISKHKDYEHVKIITQRMVAKKLTRKSCLIAIGGGYVADITGFAASIYMRGIDFIEIPTTLIAMGDPVIGKVAVNFFGYKNILGSFYSPRFVFCDTNFLKTLNTRELVLGLVEIWKHGIISHNKKIIKDIDAYLRVNKLSNPINLIHLSITVKRKYVERDYRDMRGPHKALSLGHTFANYFENKFKIRHGEAVFYGIILATILASNLKLITENRRRKIFYIAKLFERYLGLLQYLQSKIITTNLLKEIKFDKINSHNKYTFVLPTETGYRIESEIPAKILRQTVNKFIGLKGF